MFLRNSVHEIQSICHQHISKASIFLFSTCRKVHVTTAFKNMGKTGVCLDFGDRKILEQESHHDFSVPPNILQLCLLFASIFSRQLFLTTGLVYSTIAR